ncbi:hypothetical protein EXIGLDRAFT_844126 [Exidia glandulosa HHB12029]|uniref:F-box domain-containing protein n=1 Tax=Exidia glandulosa HHB12029 TaxID=1314781 RepID=A0A165C8E1_EXIGL|nr:hypothetical protein EXIGLDRAFT_844126 [Exidia glandulosa HHB12029]
MSPATNLPTELLLSILDHADRGTTVLAGRVSQRWRALATTHPNYRAHIPLSISYGVTSSRVRAPVSRFRSRIDAATAHGVRMEVDVSATYGTERWLYSQHGMNTHSVSAVDQTLVRTICDALPLTVTLHLSLCARIYDVFQDEARQDPAPLLERLTLLVWSYSFGYTPLALPLDFLCGTAPLLRDVSLRNVPLTLHVAGALERPSAFRNVRYLFLRLGHQHSLQSITEHFSNLKSLSIDLSDGLDVEDDASDPALGDFDAQVAEWGARLGSIHVCLGWRTAPPPSFVSLLQSAVPVLDVTWISSAAEAPDEVPIAPYLRHLSGPLEMSVTVGKNDWETALCLHSSSTGMTRTFSTPAYLHDVNGSSRFLLGRDIVTQNFSDERNRDLLQAVVRFQASWKLCGEVDWVQHLSIRRDLVPEFKQATMSKSGV